MTGLPSVERLYFRNGGMVWNPNFGLKSTTLAVMFPAKMEPFNDMDGLCVRTLLCKSATGIGAEMGKSDERASMLEGQKKNIRNVVIHKVRLMGSWNYESKSVVGILRSSSRPGWGGWFVIVVEALGSWLANDWPLKQYYN